MSRRIPTPGSVVLPDTLALVPGAPVLAGSASVGGHWYDFASLYNLNLAMVHAQPVHEQQWNGGFVFNTGAFTSRYEVTVPKLTDQHLGIECRVYGHSPATGGQIRFTATTSGNTSTVAVPAAAAWQAGATSLSMAGSFGVNDYETILVESNGDVDIQAVALEYKELRPGGTYPGADDALAVSTAVDGAWPLDTDELAADKPLSAETFETLTDGTAAVDGRVRVYSSWGDVTGAGSRLRPFRVLVPVFDMGASLHTLNYRIKGLQGGATRTHFIGHGPQTNEDAYQQWLAGVDARGFTGVDISAGGGSEWKEGTISLLAGDIIPAPGGYFGWVQLTVYPADGLLSFSLWGK